MEFTSKYSIIPRCMYHALELTDCGMCLIGHASSAKPHPSCAKHASRTVSLYVFVTSEEPSSHMMHRIRIFNSTSLGYSSETTSAFTRKSFTTAQ